MATELSLAQGVHSSQYCLQASNNVSWFSHQLIKSLNFWGEGSTAREKGLGTRLANDYKLGKGNLKCKISHYFHTQTLFGENFT